MKKNHACFTKFVLGLTAFSTIFSLGLKADDLSHSILQIQNQAEPGSGFFLNIGDKVVFITAKHVLGSSGEKVILSLPDNSKLEIALDDQIPINALDTALIRFKDTPVGITPLQLSKKKLVANQNLKVWGFPVSDNSYLSHLESRTGSYLGSPISIQDGYSLLYGAKTQIGFSGGPILDDDGMVVGMHGRAESTRSSAGQSVRTGNALGIPIDEILSAISSSSQAGQQIDEKILAANAGRSSMKRVYEIMTNTALSDQILEELVRAEKAGIPKYCIEISKAYYYTFFSSLPDLYKATLSQTITKNVDGVDPVYFALASMISKRSADFKKSLAYDRILEQTGNSVFLQYSERRLIDEVKSVVNRCANP